MGLGVASAKARRSLAFDFEASALQSRNPHASEVLRRNTAVRVVQGCVPPKLIINSTVSRGTILSRNAMVFASVAHRLATASARSSAGVQIHKRQLPTPDWNS